MERQQPWTRPVNVRHDRRDPCRHTLHECFERQASRTPHAIAVVCEGRTLTYEALDRRANAVARFLLARGIEPDTLVGLCVERSLDLVVGLVGILKAGAAYVPLDPASPAERLRFLLEDAAPRVLLTQQHLKDRFTSIDAPVVALDSEWDALCAEAECVRDDLRSAAQPHHLAYVIYTSGSTGRPKGVMVEHRNGVRLFTSTAHWFGFGERDVWTLFHSFAFDFSVWEIWGALLYGGRLVIVPQLTARSPREFYRLLCEEGVTVLNQTPSAFAQLIEAQAQSDSLKHSLRYVIFGGEALDLRRLRPWVERHGVERPRLINMYGITETTVHVTFHPLTEAEIRDSSGSPIGVPIPDLSVHLLDEHRRPVSPGAVGEIYVGGAGVARGYLNRPELTAGRFFDAITDAGLHERLYRSGDLARCRPDGSLEYLGRNDQQVKLRGFRIELGEIEAQLARHPRVRDAVVRLREDRPGEPQLVAYIVPSIAGTAQEAPGVEELRGWLRLVLPDYMVPSAFVRLERFPLTLNGKLDYAALPAPEADAYSARAYAAPRGEREETLAAIWQDLLHVERVGRDDNFFELGGHSLRIVALMDRLRRAGWTTDVRAVFESATLADLAGTLTPHAGEVEVPESCIPPGCEAITPGMLPLVELEPDQIAQIVRAVPGGAGNVQDVYPLAPLQEGILFHHRLSEQGGGDTYVLNTLMAVESRERVDELIAALQAVIDRHDVLRTAVLWEHLPRPVQVVHRRATLPVEEIEADAGTSALEQLRHRMRPELQRLELRRAPMMKLAVAKDARDPRWYALLSTHHLVCDNESLEILLGEAMAYLGGRPEVLPPPAPYRNHVAQAVAAARQQDADAFFRRKLGDVTEPTAPFGLADVHGDAGEIDEARETLDATLVSRARVQARRLGVSLATLVHSAWALVVARTSSCEDVVFGSVLLGRLQGSAGAQRILGMFINTLPLRVQMDDVTAAELVRRTHHELVELIGYEQASLSAAQRCSGVTGGAPLFSALLNYRHREPDAARDWSSAPGVEVLRNYERTNYPITLSIDDSGESLAMTAQTDRRVDPRRIIDYVSTAIASLVHALEARPDVAALSLEVLPERERHRLLDELNGPALVVPQGVLVHELFGQQVARTPDAIALEHEGRSMTYAELDARARELAIDLAALGVRRGQVVGVCVERSFEMIVAVLAALKAGAAYLPLDPHYPADRIGYMIEDAAPRLVLTQRKLAPLFRHTSVRIRLLDECAFQASPAGGAPSVASEGLTTDDLVYVIYTSGSTGRPKGTAMPHGAMVNLLEWHRAVFGERTGTRTLQFAALSFDVAFQETFSTLCTGGTLVLLDEWSRRDARELARFIAECSIERLFLPPLMLQGIAEVVQSTGIAPMALRDVITAGEPLRITPEVAALFARLPDCRLHNHYGPTETHVVTALTLTGEPSGWPMLPSIGRPIANTRIHVLDRNGQLVPQGAVGEIYIGGAQLACGYLHRPELTEERFRRDPFSADASSRLYRTGDLGRWREDGTLEFLGRNDQQVKIRGFRIELGEIEAQLARHAAVKECAVVPREDAPGEKRLVAYVVPRADRGPDTARLAEELRAHLGAVLPDHMLPTAFVTLGRLPLTPNGKLDRRALPAPDTEHIASEAHEPPSTEVERVLAGIWKRLLRVEQVGRRDNFFDLGGHSLLATRVISHVSHLLEVDIPIRELFRRPTLEALSRWIEAERSADVQMEAP